MPKELAKNIAANLIGFDLLVFDSDGTCTKHTFHSAKSPEFNPLFSGLANKQGSEFVGNKEQARSLFFDSNLLEKVFEDTKGFKMVLSRGWRSVVEGIWEAAEMKKNVNEMIVREDQMKGGEYFPNENSKYKGEDDAKCNAVYEKMRDLAFEKYESDALENLKKIKVFIADDELDQYGPLLKEFSDNIVAVGGGKEFASWKVEHGAKGPAEAGLTATAWDEINKTLLIKLRSEKECEVKEGLYGNQPRKDEDRKTAMARYIEEKAAKKPELSPRIEAEEYAPPVPSRALKPSESNSEPAPARTGRLRGRQGAIKIKNLPLRVNTEDPARVEGYDVKKAPAAESDAVAKIAEIKADIADIQNANIFKKIWRILTGSAKLMERKVVKKIESGLIAESVDYLRLDEKAAKSMNDIMEFLRVADSDVASQLAVGVPEGFSVKMRKVYDGKNEDKFFEDFQSSPILPSRKVAWASSDLAEESSDDADLPKVSNDAYQKAVGKFEKVLQSLVESGNYSSKKESSDNKVSLAFYSDLSADDDSLSDDDLSEEYKYLIEEKDGQKAVFSQGRQLSLLELNAALSTESLQKESNREIKLSTSADSGFGSAGSLFGRPGVAPSSAMALSLVSLGQTKGMNK